VANADFAAKGCRSDGNAVEQGEQMVPGGSFNNPQPETRIRLAAELEKDRYS
jgi:hypothetical protein